MNKTDKAKKRRPLRRAQHWGSQVLPMAGRIVSVLIVLIVLGLMFSALQAIENTFLRVGLSLLIASGMLLMHFNEGLSRGTMDAAASVFYMQASEAGKTLDAKDDAACYHPLKAVCAVLAVYGLPLALSVIIALTAKEYTYALQDLPVWLTDTYGVRSDVMAPLGAYSAGASLVVTDWIRLFVRLPQMLYVTMFSDPMVLGATIDRLSPLFIATYPLAYVIGYLRGPAGNRKQRKMNRRAKKVAAYRAEKKTLAQELTGVQNAVHYGHKRDEDKPKRKELV